MNFTNKLQNHVKDFHEAFSHPVGKTPAPISVERAVNRSIWTAEECIEFIAASCDSKEQFEQVYATFAAGIQKAFEKSLNGDFTTIPEEKVIHQADALADQLYFSFGSAVEIGVDIEPVFDIVQAANMSKLFTDENGRKYAKCREDGKIMKSPEFFSPEPFIEKEVKHQIEATIQTR
jgi:predicted HAD superfamily Cof-like phosphohydrolase